MVFVQNGIIAKRLESLEEKESETICIEFTDSKKKRSTMFPYRLPKNDNKVMFFNELDLSLNQCVNKYDNIIVMGDLTIGISDKRKGNNNFVSDLCDTFFSAKHNHWKNLP